jgi:hypothetical protein
MHNSLYGDVTGHAAPNSAEQSRDAHLFLSIICQSKSMLAFITFPLLTSLCLNISNMVKVCISVKVSRRQSVG